MERTSSEKRPVFVQRLTACALVGFSLWLNGCGCDSENDSAEGDPETSELKESSDAASEASVVSEAANKDTSPTQAADPIADQPKDAPLVNLSGQARPLAVQVVKPGPRLHAIDLRAWVHERPDPESRRLGYLRAGSSSPTAAKPAGFAGCKQGWYPVEPGGYICVGRTATLDGEHPIAVAAREHPPDHMQKLPYMYGTVRRPGPIYRRLPSAEELRRAERDTDKRMPTWLEAKGEIGASFAQHVWEPHVPPEEVTDPKQAWETQLTQGVPEYLQGGKSAPNLLRFKGDLEALSLERMRPKVGFSFLKTFFHEGRRYGVTTDLRILPTDRLRPIQGSDFHGYEIPSQAQFPFAIIRRPGAHYYSLAEKNGRLVQGKDAEYGAAVQLTGKQQFFNKILHYETTDGFWLSDREASRMDPARRMPKWGSDGEKWIDINLTKQTLMLYEGTEPVFATLISSGSAGLADHETSTATKRGIFRVHTKHITATMSSAEVGEEFELRDVPYVQYYDTAGYALHGAYWHDRFGTPRSHGCINLSPEDARRVFYWTEPKVPNGWHGVLLPLRGTIMFVHQ